MSTTIDNKDKEQQYISSRVDNLKPTSSAYKYYKFTPLSELKNRDERLIKKEIERRERQLLLEGPFGLGGNVAPDSGDVAPATDAQPEPDAKPATTGTSLWELTSSWLDSIGSVFSSLGSAMQGAYKNVTDYMSGLASKYFGADKETGDVVAHGAFGSAVAILALVAIWKLVKKYATKDGAITAETSTEEVAASESINPIKDNVGYAVLTEASTDEELKDSSKDEMGGIIKKYADKLVDELLNDDLFVAYMGKANPELLEKLKDYKKDDMAPVTEANEYIGEYFKDKNYLEGLLQSIAGDKMDKQADQFKQFFYERYREIDKLTDSFNSRVRSSESNITSQIHDLKDIMIIQSSAIGLAGVAFLLYKAWKLYKARKLAKEAKLAADVADIISNKKAKETETNENIYLNKYIRAMKLISEIKESLDSSPEKIRIPSMKELRSKEKEAVKNLISRAKFVSIDLLSDKDFVSFAKKKNPDSIKKLKALNKINPEKIGNSIDKANDLKDKIDKEIKEARKKEKAAAKDDSSKKK